MSERSSHTGEVRTAEVCVALGGAVFGAAVGAYLSLREANGLIFHEDEAFNVGDKISSLQSSTSSYEHSLPLFTGQAAPLNEQASTVLRHAIARNQSEIKTVEAHAPHYGLVQRAEMVPLGLAEMIGFAVVAAVGADKVYKKIQNLRRPTLSDQPLT
jgi:hypothetical protein